MSALIDCAEELTTMESNNGNNTDAPEPPALASEQTVLKIGLVGGASALLSAAIGGIFSAGPNAPEWINDYLVPARVLLSVLSMIVVGSSIAMRYRWPAIWLLAAGTCLLAGFGFPVSWDSFRLVAFIFAALALFGSLLVALPMAWRMGVISALTLFHFSGIFVAVTSPPSAPFLTNQIWAVAYRPYLQFAYLNNAYHFYSPQPGPASEVWFCIKYESLVNDPVQMEVLELDSNGAVVRNPKGQAIYSPMFDANGDLAGEPVYDANGTFIFKEETVAGLPLKRPLKDLDDKYIYIRSSSWVKLPRRERDFKDPLGQAYYRRLSLTEYASHSTAITEFPLKVLGELQTMRNTQANIPINLAEFNLSLQCRIPNPEVAQFIIPNYVRQIAEKNRRAERPIASIMVYCATHAILGPEYLVGKQPGGRGQPVGFYDPRGYLPYYLGEFNAKGDLLAQSDPMLYWLVPIIRNPDAKDEDFIKAPRKLKLADYKRLYRDYVMIHSDSNHMEGELEK